MRPSFFLYFREFRKTRSHGPGSQSAPRLYNRYNLCQCARPAHVGKCWPGPEFKFSKTVEVGWLHLDLQLCEREIATDEILEEEKYIERSNIKSASVSAPTGSVPRKMAKGRQRVSAHCWNRTQVARLSATHLNH